MYAPLVLLTAVTVLMLAFVVLLVLEDWKRTR